jgi:hypothetical protein
MRTLTFGYSGTWTPDFNAAQQAATLVKPQPPSSLPFNALSLNPQSTPIGVEILPGNPAMAPQPGYFAPMNYYRVVTNNEYQQAAANRRLCYTA